MAKERIAYVTYICDQCNKVEVEASWLMVQLDGSPKGWGTLTIRRPHPKTSYAEQRIDLCATCVNEMWDFFEQRKALLAGPATRGDRAVGGDNSPLRKTADR
jgi:hypothetical protein